MKVSTKGRYALRMMVDLAAVENEGGYASLRDVAERLGVSMKYMEQIVSILSKAGLVNSVRGPQGGYRLARPASEYTVGEILRVTEGELVLVSCLGHPETDCPRIERCSARPVWQGLSKVIIDYVRGITLDMVLRESAAADWERI